MPAIKLYFYIKKRKYILIWKVVKEKCFPKVNAQNILKHCPATIFLVLLSAEKKIVVSYSFTQLRRLTKARGQDKIPKSQAMHRLEINLTIRQAADISQLIKQWCFTKTIKNVLPIKNILAPKGSLKYVTGAM